jgi:hypothetical protein
MVYPMKASGLMDRDKGMGCKFGQIILNTLVNGKITKLMVEGSSITQMGTSMMENG